MFLTWSHKFRKSHEPRRSVFRKSAGKNSVSLKHTMNYEIRKQGGRAQRVP